MIVGFYADQLRLLLSWTGGRGGVARRGVATLVTAMLALVVTAWLLPGITVRDVPSAAGAAVALYAMRMVLRPALVAYVSRVSMAVATIVTVLMQALAFWLISQVGWIAVDGVMDALIGSVIFSVVNALVTAVLSTGDDLSFFGTLVRQLQTDHVAGNEPGQVDDADAIKRGRGGRVESYAWDHDPAFLGRPLSRQIGVGRKGGGRRPSEAPMLMATSPAPTGHGSRRWDGSWCAR